MKLANRITNKHLYYNSRFNWEEDKEEKIQNKDKIGLDAW